jgi:hypothetical protein
VVSLARVARIALRAVVTASMGRSLTAADSLSLLVFAGAACMLGAVAARSERRASLANNLGAQRLIWLNVWTAVSFVAFFLGVAIDGAAVATISVCRIAIDLASGLAVNLMALLGGTQIVAGNHATDMQPKRVPRLSPLCTTHFSSELRTQPAAPIQCERHARRSSPSD